MITEFQGSNRFLSNFWPCKIEDDGITFPSVEHAYQAAKSTDRSERKRIACMTAGDAKRAGRSIRNLRPDWDLVKTDVMARLVRRKFTTHLDLRTLLLATGDAPLQEGNRWGDTFWGVDLRTNRGENRLGKILMAVRSDLRKPD